MRSTIAWSQFRRMGIFLYNVGYMETEFNHLGFVIIC